MDTVMMHPGEYGHVAETQHLLTQTEQIQSTGVSHILSTQNVNESSMGKILNTYYKGVVWCVKEKRVVCAQNVMQRGNMRAQRQRRDVHGYVTLNQAEIVF